jgi:glycosyltransferase involved in cell wall biosynthesis
MAECPKTVKLLHITTVPDSLGFLKGQIGYMKTRGLEIHAISSAGEFLIEFAQQEQVSVDAVTMHRSITPLQDIYAIAQLWQHLRRVRPQIVHSHTPKGGLLGTISAWLAGVPIRIYHIRGLPLMTAKGYKRFLLWWSEKVSCLLANQVLCVSYSIRDVVVSEDLCPANKVKVLLNGSGNGVDAKGQFNCDRFGENVRQETRRKYGIPEDSLVVGFVGRIVRDKGVGELVLAWKILRLEFPNLHLLVVGSFEPQDAVSKDVESLLKSDPRIHLTGLEWNTPPLYAAMDILTLPTYREGFPNVPLEAAAMQLPVVATQIPGCIDSVENGVTGILVPPRNIDALVDGLRTYLKDPELRCQHGQAGRDRVLQKFRQEAIWEALYQEYKQLLQGQDLSLPNPVSNSRETLSL